MSPRLASGDLSRLGRIVGDKTACDLAAVRPDHRDRVAALESRLDTGRTPGRQQALAGIERPHGAGVDRQPAGGPSWPAIQVLRAATGEPPARTGTALARVDRRKRIERLAGGDDHGGAGRRRDLAGLDLGAHAAARQFGAGGARHGLDLAA